MTPFSVILVTPVIISKVLLPVTAHFNLPGVLCDSFVCVTYGSLWEVTVEMIILNFTMPFVIHTTAHKIRGIFFSNEGFVAGGFEKIECN